MKKRPTIDDVALKAGVSRQTVSRAINDMQGISSRTRDHVMDVVADLGYRPSRLAKGMAGNRSLTFGLIVTDVTNPAHATVVRGLQDTAQENNYNVFLRNTDADKGIELEALRSFEAENVDGIVIVGSQLDEVQICNLANANLPIVVVHRLLSAPYVSSISTDIKRATKTAIEYLFGTGHVNIGLITCFGDLETINHVLGYRQAYESHGLELQAGWIMQAEKNLAGGHSAAMRILTRNDPVTALFAYNDLMAIGALRACMELGRRVPEDVSVMGYDDIALTSYVTPTLSTIRFNGYAVGRAAIYRLLEMISEPETVFPVTLLDIELVIRESTNIS